MRRPWPRTFEVLGKAVDLAVPKSSCDRIIELLDALASDYVWALRCQLSIEYDDLKRVSY